MPPAAKRAPPDETRGELGDDVVVVPTSLEESNAPAAAGTGALELSRVAQWTLQEVQAHVFFLAWVCGIPVHLRYVAHLLQHSCAAPTAGAPAPGGASSESEAASHWAAEVQADVFAPVCRRATEVHRRLTRWPTAPLPVGRPTTDATAASPLVTLGVLESAAPDALAHRSGPAPLSIEAGAVQPSPRFSNVTALALWQPPSGDAVEPCATVPDPVWCARAYWTAVTQAQRWVAVWPASTSDSGAHAAALADGISRTAAAPAAGNGLAVAPMLRPGAAVSEKTVVVVEMATQEGGGRPAKVPRHEAPEFIVVDSDDDDVA